MDAGGLTFHVQKYSVDGLYRSLKNIINDKDMKFNFIDNEILALIHQKN